MLSLRHKVPPPLGGSISLQSAFKCLIFCVSRLAFVHTLKVPDFFFFLKSQGRKINRGDIWTFEQVTSACVRACVCLCVYQSECKWLCVCVTKWRQSSAARVPDQRGPSKGWKGQRKRWDEERWRRETDQCTQRNVAPLTSIRLNKFTGGFKSDYICLLISASFMQPDFCLQRTSQSPDYGWSQASPPRWRLVIFCFVVLEPQRSL